MGKAMLLISISCLTLLFSPAVFATGPNLIGIQLSQACMKMEMNHVKSNCISYDKLKQLDNSNSLLEGQWINDTWFHRTTGHVKNAYQYYNDNKWIVSVDPNSEYTTRAKMIIIQSDNFTYANPSEIVGQNHTRTEFHNRFVSACSEALVSPNFNLINDTIRYLENGCTNSNYTDTVKVYTPAFAWDYNNPYSTLHYQSQLGEIFNHHTILNGNVTRGGVGPVDCIHHHCNYKDPYANW